MAKKEHRVFAKVINDKKLNSKQKKYLEGVHRRNQSYASEPSKQDLDFLQQCYSSKPPQPHQHPPQSPQPPQPSAGACTDPPITNTAQMPTPIAAQVTPSTVGVQRSMSEIDNDLNINEIASHYMVQIGTIDSQFAEKHLRPVAKLLTIWRACAPSLCLSDLDIAAIERIQSSLAWEKPHEMLKKWRQRCYYSDKGHYRYLLNVILQVDGDELLVGKICKILAK